MIKMSEEKTTLSLPKSSSSQTTPTPKPKYKPPVARKRKSKTPTVKKAQPPKQQAQPTPLDIIMEIYKTNPIVYRTNNVTINLIRKEFDLHALVLDKIPNATVSNVYSINKKLKNNQYIISLNDPNLKINKKDISLLRNYIKQNDQNVISPQLSKSNAEILVLNDKLGNLAIENLLKNIKQTKIPSAIKPIPTSIVPAGTQQKEYATFENQIIHSERRGINISDLFEDIVTYLETPYYRRCPKCGEDTEYYLAYNFNVFLPNADPQDSIATNNIIIDYADAYLDNKATYNNNKKQFPFKGEKIDPNSALKGIIDVNINSQTEYDGIQDELYDIFYCKNDQCEFYIHSGKTERFHLFKEQVVGTDNVIWNILLGLKQGKGVLLFGYPGDGKSTICVQFLDYFEWKYSTGYLTLNVDESTTSFQLRGGISPDIFALGDISKVDERSRIEYGLIPMALLSKDFTKTIITRDGKKTVRIGQAKNFFADEVNRTDFRNISFTMGFYASPYQFTLKEDNNRVFPNPNALYGETRWISLATMNTADVGNEALSLAFKRRFHIVQVEFDQDHWKEVFKSIFRVDEQDWRVQVALTINSMTNEWKKSVVLFPAGIGHVLSFIKEFELSIEDLYNDKLKKALNLDPNDRPGNLRTLVKNILDATVKNAIVDENSPTKVTTLNSRNEKLIDKIKDILVLKGIGI